MLSALNWDKTGIIEERLVFFRLGTQIIFKDL